MYLDMGIYVAAADDDDDAGDDIGYDELIWQWWVCKTMSVGEVELPAIKIKHSKKLDHYKVLDTRIIEYRLSIALFEISGWALC